MARARIELLLPLVLSGCPSPPDLQWEGEFVRLGAEDPKAICGGTREYLDRRAGELLDRFGTSHTIDYYWVPSGVDPFCPDYDAGVAGCVHDHEVYSTWIPHQHELVHAAGTDMPRALEEGLATHWGDPWPFESMASRDVLHPLLLQEIEIADRDEYARMAHFLSYLSENHGGNESLVALDRALDNESTADDVNRAFLDVFGLSLDQAVMEYESYPDCSGFIDVSLSCAKTPIVISTLEPEIIRDIDCASNSAIGPFDGMAFVEEVIDLQPQVGGDRIVQVQGDGVPKGGRAVLRRCGPCTENGVAVFGGSDFVFLNEEQLPPGRYLLRLYVPIEETPTNLGLWISG